MYPVSDAYLSAIRAKSRTDRLTGTIVLTDGTEVPVSDSNIESGSVEWERSCVTGEELTFGEVILGELRIGIITDLSRYLFYGGKISLTYELQLADGTWEAVPIGTFTIGEAERNANAVSIISYDGLITMDNEYGGAAYYGTPYEIALAVCEVNGMVLANTEEEFLTFPNGDQIIQIDEDSGCETYRDCLKLLGQLTGTFIIADRAGQVLFKQYDKEPRTTITSAERYTPTVSDFVVRYIGIIIESDDAEYLAYDPDGESGLEMEMETTVFNSGLEATLQARTENLLSELLKIQYTPCELPMPGDPAFDCGDMVSLPLDEETTANSLITKISWNFRGRMEMESAGKNPLLYGLTPKKASVIRKLQAQTAANKLIFYSFTNQNDISVSDENEKEISQVTFATTETTSAMFIAQLPVSVEAADTSTSTTTETEKTVTVKNSAGTETTITDASGNALTLTVMDSDTVTTVERGYVDLQVEYYLNGTLVDYELVQRLTAGKHILALFYTFAALDGNASYQWQVKIKVVGGSGTATVPKRGFRATVTGQGMAGTDDWDGTINIDESVPALSLVSRLSLVSASEEVTTETQVPTASSIEETVSGFGLRSRLALAKITDEPGVNPVWEQQTISSASLQRWEYASRYVWLTDSGVQLRTAWDYKSAEQAIDSGRMTVVKAVASDLASVESLEVGTA